MKEKLGIALVMAAMFQFSNLNAAPIDREIAILAAEQSQSEQQPKAEEKVETPTPKTKKELEAEEKRLRKEKRDEEKRLKAEKEAARKKIEEGKREQIPISNDKNGTRRNNNTRLSSEDNKSDVVKTATENSVAPVKNSNVKPTPVENNNSVTKPEKNPVENNNSIAKPAENPVTPTVENPIATTPNNISNIPQELPLQSSSPTDKNVGMPNPLKSYSSFEEVSAAVGFTPLYIPKKSGYTINSIMSIDNRIAEIRYGRRWEPEVSLAVRTYKRSPNEELQDISGVQGAKWRADESSGSTVYLAKISDDNHAAAWAVGDFTFSAYVENLSFAAFYALVIEELVDLSNHYYVA